MKTQEKNRIRLEDQIDWGRIFSLHSLFFIFLGVFMATIAFKGFMIPNRFLDGGVIGLSILFHEIFHLDIRLILLVLNIPFIYIGYYKIGKTFAIQTTMAVVLLIGGMNFLEIPAKIGNSSISNNSILCNTS